ncbi:MAG: hypothetical protein IJS25_02550, partial [Bacteroidales bacterium]|nr:hypothetical protein [Bacteroidales bacterium]
RYVGLITVSCTDPAIAQGPRPGNPLSGEFSHEFSPEKPCAQEKSLSSRRFNGVLAQLVER